MDGFPSHLTSRKPGKVVVRGVITDEGGVTVTALVSVVIPL